jgi:hypothetical protein
MKKTTIPMATFSALNPRDRADFIRFGGEVCDNPKASDDGAKSAARIHLEARAGLLLKSAGAAVEDLTAYAITDSGLRDLTVTMGPYTRKLAASNNSAARAKVVDHMLGTLAGRPGGAHEVLVGLGIHKPSKPAR